MEFFINYKKNFTVFADSKFINKKYPSFYFENCSQNILKFPLFIYRVVIITPKSKKAASL